MIVILAYDIASDTRRARLAAALESWGYRLQESVFQLRLEPAELDEVRRQVTEIINQTDILYMTRVQRERFTDPMEYERVKNVYILHRRMLDGSRENLRVLHPLPRVNEISYDVDDSPKAYYIQQARNGLFTREAIICDVLGIEVDD